jgi:hypothetical protein
MTRLAPSGREPAELHEENPEIRYDRYKAVRLNSNIARQKPSSPGRLGLLVSFSLIIFRPSSRGNGGKTGRAKPA